MPLMETLTKPSNCPFLKKPHQSLYCLANPKRSITFLCSCKNPTFISNQTAFSLSLSSSSSPFSSSLSSSSSSSSSPSIPVSTALDVSPSSTIKSATSEELEAAGENDLLIVGPGVLGRLVAEKWRQEHPGCQVYGQTISTNHHEELIKLGINPCLKGTKPAHQYPNVIFCAPTSRTADYPGDVRAAALSWNGEGCFIFTSSSALYDCNDNGECNEDTPEVPIGRSPRTDVLLKAEKVVLESDGCVVRLAGLYNADRGAHNYYLVKGTSEVRPDHILNLIHYEDAASLCFIVMKKRLHGQIFLGCDNQPLSRQEMMDLVAKSGKFSKKFEGFTGTDGPLGKKLNNLKTREELGWEPKYPSFAYFLGVSE